MARVERKAMAMGMNFILAAGDSERYFVTEKVYER